MLFLKFEKEIKGQSQQQGYKDWIGADSVDFGVGRPVGPLGGDSLGKGELHLVNARDKKVEPYLKLERYDAMVTSYYASSGGDRPSESFSINFSKISYQYDKWDGGKKATGTAKKWDLTKNEKFA